MTYFERGEAAQSREQRAELYREGWQAGEVKCGVRLAQEKLSGLSGVAQEEINRLLSEGFALLEECYASIRALADGGDLAALTMLATYYQWGVGGEQSDEKAFECVWRAGNQGYDGAYKEIALCYAEGIGVSQDVAKALVWLEKARKNT